MNKTGTMIIDYFKNGILYKVSTSDADSYKATVFVADGVRYDLLNEKDISKLPIPKFENNEGMFPNVTASEDYILRMVAGNIRDIDKHKGLLLMIKAFDMMEASPIDWQKRDYLRLAKWLYEDGQFEAGQYTEDYINKKHPDIVAMNSEDIKKKNLFFKLEKQYYYLKYNHPNLAPRSKHAFTSLYTENPEQYRSLIKNLPMQYR